MRPSWTLAGAAFAALALIGGAIRAADASATVTIDNFAFGPAEIAVPAGTTVTWRNHDDIPHTVTDAADPREFKSPPLDSDESYSRLFAKAGVYHYFCSLHPHMTGTVVVK